MRVLHLFSNHKWTGPAEPAVSLASRLRAQGLEARFACSRRPAGAPNSVADGARAWGLEPLLELALPKHLAPWTLLADARALRALCDREDLALIHAHQRNDHLTAAIARRGARRMGPFAHAKGRALVRSLYDGEPGPLGWRERRLYRGPSDALLCVSRAVRDALVGPAGLDPARVRHIETGVPLDRFDPARWSGAAKRQAWGLAPDDFVFGIVARMQRHRRYGVLLEGFARVAHQRHHVHLVVVGGGTHREAVAHQPARELGLEGRVHFVGYQFGEDYTRTLAALDAKIFLVPGSDGSCRAVREAMAMGLPVLAARRGILPELITGGADGLLVDDDAGGLARAMDELAGERERTRAWGRAARRTAEARFDLEAQARAVARVYRELWA